MTDELQVSYHGEGSPPAAANALNLQEDILVEIFKILSYYESQMRLKAFASGCQRRDWVRVTEVCRYWYSVATGTPALWSFIPGQTLDSETRTKRFLRLSKSSDLTVYCYSQTPTGYIRMRNLITVLEQIERIRHLWIDFPFDNQPSGPLFPLLEQPASRMRFIKLENTFTIEKFQLPITSSGVLKVLSLKRIDFLPNFSHLKSMSTLELTLCKNISISDLLGVLKASPQLAVLTLRSCMYTHSSLQGFEHVHLQYLLDLTLRFSYFSDCLCITQYLEVPNLLRFHISCEEKLTQNEIMKIGHFSKFVIKEYSFESIKIGIRFQEDESYSRVKIYEDPSRPGPDSSDEIIAYLGLYSDHVDASEVMTHLTRVFRIYLQKAERAHIDCGNDFITMDTWHDVLCALACAKFLYVDISICPGWNLLKALACSDPSFQSVGMAPCPELDSLDVEIDYRIQLPRRDQLFALLRDIVRTRSENGLAVRVLNLLWLQCSDSPLSQYNFDTVKTDLNQWVKTFKLNGE